MDIPEVGRYAVLKDPQGAIFVAFQPEGDGPTGAGVFVWDELGTQDVDGAETFYHEVFGWTTSDMGEEYGGYKIFNLGEKGVGGLMKMPDPSVPSMWCPYIATEDVDAVHGRGHGPGENRACRGQDQTNTEAHFASFVPP